ncbi:LamG domain-containing protein, partial [Patescibacteria group bacterium]|nr:LamG domain-containing protein [Patescibacteria group bacterium]MBU4082936.1 LamG domain-containing protein [Patescibacteria group bacterium]
GFVSPAVYVDGSVGSTITTEWHYIVFTTETAINANDMDIGKIGSSFFDGIIDEARIYNRALSADEVGELYRAGKKRLRIDAPLVNKMTDGLVGHWTFNGADMDWASTTAEALDRSGQGNNGNTVGAKAAIGVSGQGMEFDGVDDYVGCEDVYNGVKTVAFWIKADIVASKKIIDIDGTDQIETDASGNILATSFPTATIYIDSAVASLITTDWHFVAITDITGVNASAMNIGRVSAGYFDGKIDEVRVYNRALSAAEVGELYRSQSRKFKIKQ